MFRAFFARMGIYALTLAVVLVLLSLDQLL